MNKHYLRPQDWGDNYDPPRTEPHQRAAWGVIFLTLLFAFFCWLIAPSARAADITVPCKVPTVKDASGKDVVVREDGSLVTDPAGVMFNYGTAPDQLVNNWRMTNWKNCTVTIKNVDAGKTYYVAAKFYTESGEYSLLSNLVSIDVPKAALPLPELGTPTIAK